MLYICTTNPWRSYMVIDILDRSTLVPFPHPGFFLFSRFCKIGKENEPWRASCESHTEDQVVCTFLSICSNFTFTLRAIFPTSSMSFSMRPLIAGRRDIWTNVSDFQLDHCAKKWIYLSLSTSEAAPFIADALVTDFDSSLASCRFAERISCLYNGSKMNDEAKSRKR